MDRPAKDREQNMIRRLLPNIDNLLNGQSQVMPTACTESDTRKSGSRSGETILKGTLAKPYHLECGQKDIEDRVRVRGMCSV